MKGPMMMATAEHTTETGAKYRAYGREAFAHPENVLPAQADYVVCNFVERVIGHIVDARQDDPSDRTPIAEPFEAFDESGDYIACKPSLQDAMWVVVHAWEETRHGPR